MCLNEAWSIRAKLDHGANLPPVHIGNKVLQISSANGWSWDLCLVKSPSLAALSSQSHLPAARLLGRVGGAKSGSETKVQKSLAPDFAVIPGPPQPIRLMLMEWLHPSFTQSVGNKPLFSHTFY